MSTGTSSQQPLLADSDPRSWYPEDIDDWQCFRLQLDVETDVVDVFYGHKEDELRPPTIIMGITKEQQPGLGKTKAYADKMPGNGILGLEVHESGDIIGWKGPGPLNGNPAHSTWLAKGACPHTRFRFKCCCGRLHILLGNWVLYSFPPEELGTENKHFFHLYMKKSPRDGQNCNQNEINVQRRPQAEAAHEKHSIIVSVHQDYLTALHHLPFDQWTCARVSDIVIWYPSLLWHILGQSWSYIADVLRNFVQCVSPELKAAFEQGHQGKIFAIRALPGGTYICTLGEEEAKIWDIVTGRLVYDLFKPNNESMDDVNSLLCSACWCELATCRKDVIAMGRKDFSIILMEMTSPRGDDLQYKKSTQVNHKPKDKHEHPEDRIGLRALCYDPASNALLSAGGGTVRIWGWTIVDADARKCGDTQECTDSDADTRICGDSKLLFEVEEGELITSFAMTDCQDEASKRIIAVAVENQKTSQHYLYIINVHVNVNTGKWACKEQCKIANKKDYGRITTTLLYQKKKETSYKSQGNHEDTLCTYLIFGTSSGRVVLIDAASFQDKAEVDLEGRGNLYARLGGHGKFSIWRIVVVQYRHHLKDANPTVDLLVTSCGDGTIKFWRLQDAIDLLKSNVVLGQRKSLGGRAQSCYTDEKEAFLTLHDHRGAVSALEFKEGSEGQQHDSGMCTFNISDMDQCVYSAGWDGVAYRWLLADILEPFDENMCRRDHTHISVPRPQQTYKSASLFEVLSSPASWLMNLMILTVIIRRANQPHCHEGVSKMPWLFGIWGGKVDFWGVWWPSVFLASLLVMSWWDDSYSRHRKKLDDIASRNDFYKNWRHQKEAAKHRNWMRRHFILNWMVSQFVWVVLLRFLVMIFDCTYVDNIVNGEAWKEYYLRQHPTFRKNDLVMDEDRDVQCFGVTHLVRAVPTFFLLGLYVYFSIQLLLAHGDTSLLNAGARLDITFKPLQQQWPNYAGMFTRRRSFYWFEATLVVAKICIPIVTVLSTNFPRVRFFSTGAVGLLLFFVASHKPPVRSMWPAHAITLLALFLLMTPLYQLYDFEESHEQGTDSWCQPSN